ncbi:MAG: hypothetical protein UT22_C0043G0008, partial [Parcubacteria group bacterium GW2011_GWC2_39_11]
MIKDSFWKKYSSNLILGFIDIGLIVFIIFFPARIIIEDINELSSLRKTLFSLEEQEDNFNNLNKGYRINLETIKGIDDSFINSEEPVDILTFIEDLSEELKLSTRITPTVPQKSKSDAWPSMIFRLSCKGESEKLIAFLEKLENSKHLMEVTDINLKKAKVSSVPGQEGNPSQIEAEFTLRAYVK